MTTTHTETDILIVGAGPVGLFLANECERRGLRWLLVEQKMHQSRHSKALGIFPRTLEIFDMAGLVEPFLAASNDVTSVDVISHGRHIAHMPFRPEETPYPFVAMVPQNETEEILLKHLPGGPRAVRYGTSFVSAGQHDDHVDATLSRGGEERVVTARYVVGCDGAHSAVRHVLGLGFGGGEYHESFMLADVATNGALPADTLQLCPHEDGPLAIFPLAPTRRRIVATVQEAVGEAPDLALARRLLAERAPAGIEAHELHWGSYFHIHHRHVDRLREGRIFVAGDAAHIHSPFGAQGMNTGLQDVWNLVWKLDLVLKGHGTEELLDSYDAERMPVIRHVIGITDFLTRAMATPHRLPQALRDAVIPMVSRLTPFQHAFVQQLSELGIRYDGSPIVEGPGERYLDDTLRGGRHLRSRFVLMVGDDCTAGTLAAAEDLGSTRRDVLTVRTSDKPGVTLLRPDGYIAVAEEGGDGVAAVGEAEALLAQQTV